LTFLIQKKGKKKEAGGKKTLTLFRGGACDGAASWWRTMQRAVAADTLLFRIGA